MKIKVPFILQEKFNDCGPIALKMILDFFDVSSTIEELRELSYVEESGITWTVGLSKAAAELGLKVDFYSISLNLNESNLSLDFYKKNTSKDPSNLINYLLLKNKELGVNFFEKSIDHDFIISLLEQGKIPILILDWNKIEPNPKNSFQAHFVPVVGYDESSFLVHQPGGKNPEAYQKIAFETFEQARKEPGTDEDILFIYK